MGKIAVITGGTKGIGGALVRIFAENQFFVITCSRTEKDLIDLKIKTESECNSTIDVHKTDLSRKTGIRSFASHVLSFNQPVEVLINNMGIYVPGKIHLEEEHTLEKMIENNLYSAYYLTKYLLPSMIDRKHGHIFNICSTASIVPYADAGSYGISKYALYGMSKVLREELKPFNIRVTSVLPGATYTSSWEGVDLPESRFIKPDDIAQTVWNAYSISQQSLVEEILIRPLQGDI